MIKEFYINGLHGERDVRIPFTSTCKIIVAENGYGKTSILNAFYALMFADINKLRKISFTSLGVIFNNGEEFSFQKKEFKQNIKDILLSSTVGSHLEMRVKPELLASLIDKAAIYPLEELEKTSLFQ